MLIEILSILSIFWGGYFLIRTTTLRGWSLIPVGFISGTNLLIMIGGINAISGLKTNPIIMHTLTLGIPFTIWLFLIFRGKNIKINWFQLITASIIFSGLVIFFRQANLVKWSPDTFRYMMIGNLFANGNFEAVTSSLLTTRLLSISLINASANLQGEYYLPSILPLLALSLGLLLIWYLFNGIEKPLKKIHLWTLLLLSILLLFSNNRFIYNTFYINGHLLFAIALLILCGNNWLYFRNTEIPKNTLLIMQLLAIGAIILTRPDGSILASIAILPMIFSHQFSLFYKKAILLSLGASVLIWQGFLVWVHIKQGNEVSISVSGLLVLGILSVISAFLIKYVPFGHRSKYFTWFSEFAIWLVLLAFTIIKPNVLVQSFEATRKNIIGGAGGWGSSIAILAILVILSLLITHSPGQVFLRFSITTFLPISFILAYLREGAYRIGLGDSLNRSFLHIVPLAILFIVANIGTGQWKFDAFFKNVVKVMKKNEKLQS